MSAYKRITVSDFEEMLRIEATEYLKQKIRNIGLEYHEISDGEADKLITFVVKSLISGELIPAGEERRNDWESGWAQNLKEIEEGKDVNSAIVPKYFNKYNVVRLNRRFVQPVTANFEKSTLNLIMAYIADKYLRNHENVYEFGCGTGHNLLSVRDVNERAVLHGLDWAKSSQAIIKNLRTTGVDENIYGENFDYFNPNYDVKIAKNSAIYTVASLEQVGTKWEDFIKYLLLNKPEICIHVEPIGEILNDDTLFDYLSIQYFKARNYLSGFYSGLIKLESDGMIEIIDARRTYIGSLFIEGYTIIVWKPL